MPLKPQKRTGLIFFPAFDWAISPNHPEREERLLYTQDQVFEEQYRAALGGADADQRVGHADHARFVPNLVAHDEKTAMRGMIEQPAQGGELLCAFRAEVGFQGEQFVQQVGHGIEIGGVGESNADRGHQFSGPKQSP